MGKALSASASRRSGKAKKRRKLTTGDIVARHSKKVSELRIDMIDEDIILIEGNASTFRFLGELFNTVADDDSDCGTQFYPSGPGSMLFSEKSKFGLYLHRLPCLNHPAKGSVEASVVEEKSSADKRDEESA